MELHAKIATKAHISPARHFLCANPNELSVAALEHFQYKQISNKQLANFIGLDDDEIEFADMFWEGIYNGDLIYVSRELVSTYLSDDTSKDMMQHFISRKLEKHFTEGEDFFEIDKTHPLVIQYNKRINLSNTIPEPANKKHHTMTIGTFKTLLMTSRSSKASIYRRYMLKIEQLSLVMHKYISQIDKMRATMYSSAMFDFMCDIKQYDGSTSIPIGYVYIATTNEYSKSDIYKIGSTLNPSQRVFSLNTSHNSDDSMYILKSYKTMFHKEKERAIHRVLQPYRNSKSREFFTIKHDLLVEIMDKMLLCKSIEENNV